MHVPQSLRQFRVPFWLIVVGVVLAIIGYSIALGAAVGSGRTSFILLLLAPPIIGLGLAFSLRYFQLLTLALPVAALLMPRIELPTGTETKLPTSLLIALVLTAIWGASMYIRGWKLAPSLLNAPLLWLCGVFVVSLVWGIAWRDPVLIDSPKFIFTQLGSLASLILSITAALLVGNFFTTTKQLKYLVGAFIVIGLLMTITQILHIPQAFLNDRGMWGTWVIAPAYGLLISQTRIRWYWRVVLAVVILLTFYQTMIVNADWLSGWVPSVVAVIGITFMRSWKVFLVLMVVGAIVGYGARGFFTSVADDNVADGSLERIALWEQNLRVFREHWLFGTGPAGYAIYYMTYYKADARSTHNNYLDILSQFGVAGAATWLWLSVVSMWEGWRLSRRAPPGFLKALAMIATGGWAAALVAMFFGDWVLPFAYNQGVAGYKYTVYSWLFLGTLISIRTILDRAASESAPPSDTSHADSKSLVVL